MKTPLASLLLGGVLIAACSEEPQPQPEPTAEPPATRADPVPQPATDPCRALPVAAVRERLAITDQVRAQPGGIAKNVCLFRIPTGELSLSVTAERFATQADARTWLDDKLDELARGVPARLRRKPGRVLKSKYVPVEGVATHAHWSDTQNALVFLRDTEILWLRVAVEEDSAVNREHAVALARHIEP